jgi:CheY-like chemotaxis protein
LRRSDADGAKRRQESVCILRAEMTEFTRSAPAQPDAAVRPQPLRVLIADDDRDGAMTLSTLLQLEGYEVRAVHGGQDALDAAREFKPEVVLLDIGMPKITGYEAARRLRQRYGDDCPVLIAVTGWKQASDKILATLAGFDHHVSKPYEPSELINLLAKLRPAAR